MYYLLSAGLFLTSLMLMLVFLHPSAALMCKIMEGMSEETVARSGIYVGHTKINEQQLFYKLKFVM